mmetsp:Transcript_23302/g.34203  ORF Transcript_23302/g.34203 Transcript_23302/m.34203 type:complete len:593 (-) Transcript_23302:55-1833(-)
MWTRRITISSIKPYRSLSTSSIPIKKTLKDGLTLQDFLNQDQKKYIKTLPNKSKRIQLNDSLSFYIETYGCQMNVSDSEIVRSVLLDAGHSISDTIETADIILANTCAIRENAEAKVWHRLNYFKSIKSKNRVHQQKPGYPIVGVLGCMAERLKTSLLEEESVDFVCGPDAYRDIPLLVNIATSTDQKAANVQLSLEETYADITPVREVSSTSAFVSIMRGCNNMCAYCIVPFTRGRERSRAVSSIVSEVRALSEQGVKEVVLLGQNVNSYHDTSKESKEEYPEGEYNPTPGFNNMFKLRSGAGARFGDLLAAVAAVDPEIRIRFTSPHPKDFPEEVLTLIAKTPNICNSLHLPAQSGNSRMLEVMRRGYTREAYLELVRRARDIIPGVTISSDFISGFCSETPEEHSDTISLLREVQYEQAFMFAYSMRDRTHAQYKLEDDVSEDEKLRRLQEVISTFRQHMLEKNLLEEGRLHLVLVEGPSKRSKPGAESLTGRTDGNKRCVFPATPASVCVPRGGDVTLSELLGPMVSGERTADLEERINSTHGEKRVPVPGDYAVVEVKDAKGQVLYGRSLAITTLMDFHHHMGSSHE